MTFLLNLLVNLLRNVSLYKVDMLLACLVLFTLCTRLPGLSHWDVWCSAHMRKFAPTVFTFLQMLRILTMLSIFWIGKFGALTEEAFAVVSDTVLRYMSSAAQVAVVRDVYNIDQRLFISIVAVTVLRISLCFVYAVFTYIGQLFCGYAYSSDDLSAIAQLWRDADV